MLKVWENTPLYSAINWPQALFVPYASVQSVSPCERLVSILGRFCSYYAKVLFMSTRKAVRYSVDNNLLYSLQSAFTKYHSTETALIDIVDRMLLNIDDNCINGLLLADFQKAFDLVNHDILIEKLHIYGLDDNSLDLAHSFLQNRTQRMVIWSAQSSPQTLTHGVPQGSIPSPLLFLVQKTTSLRQYHSPLLLTSSQMTRI